MTRKLWIVCGFVIGLGVLVVVSRAAASTLAAVTNPTVVLAQDSDAPRWNVSSASVNWAGYVTTINSRFGRPLSGDVTDVKGQWVVPVVTCGQMNAYSATWIGIDGVDDNTVEQIGTNQDCVHGSASYAAWFEFLPSPSREIANLSVRAGDLISAEVRYTGPNPSVQNSPNNAGGYGYGRRPFGRRGFGGNNGFAPGGLAGNASFVLTLTNVTTGQTTSVTRAVFSAHRQSEEWVEEAPFSRGILPLANFNTIQFSGASATFRGHTGSISDSTWTNTALVMQTRGGPIKAQTSGLSSDGTGFTVMWKNS